MTGQATTRRALLAGGIGAIAAVVGRMVAPLGLRAATGSPLIIGENNTGSETTSLASIDGYGAPALEVTGPMALWAEGNGGETAVLALAKNWGAGVTGLAPGPRFTGGYDAPAWPSTVGVRGTTRDRSTPYSEPPGPGDGVFGEAGTGTGVYGTADGGRGVVGESRGGIGVAGISSETGYLGWDVSSNQAPPGTGVYGWGIHVGVYAARADPDQTALQAVGRVKFSRSGRAKVLAGRYYVDVTVPDGLAGTPLIFANLSTYRSGVWVSATRPNYPSAGRVRIYLNKVVSGTTYLSWFVLG